MTCSDILSTFNSTFNLFAELQENVLFANDTNFDRGGWIRTRAGRFRHLWRKSEAQKYRYRQHIFCNATQCTLLDKMVTKYWKRRRYYVDDPYEPYHTREEFPYTRKKPLPPPPH